MQFDAGSCIDGRLTSAWNWGSKIEKKDYYHIFKICGFVGTLPALKPRPLPSFPLLSIPSMEASPVQPSLRCETCWCPAGFDGEFKG